MNLKTGILAIAFFVALGVILAGQRLQIRSAGYEVGALERELRELDEENRVLDRSLNTKRDPTWLFHRARELGLDLAPPEAPRDGRG